MNQNNYFEQIFSKFLSRSFSPKERELLSQSELIKSWNQKFYNQLYSQHNGYPKTVVYKLNELEREGYEILENMKIETSQRTEQPTFFLTHDLDYIYATPQYYLKNAIGRGRFSPLKTSEILKSIEEFYSFEKELNLKSINFIPLTHKSLNPMIRSKQWLFDPWYSSKDSEFVELLDLLKSYKVDIGLHGSMQSVSGQFLDVEKQDLENATGTTIKSIRQHWLEIPNDNFYNYISSMGIENDFSLGWNGQLGIRTGIPRSYPIQTNNKVVNCFPMAIMDGVLFDDMKLDTREANSVCRELIDKFKEVNGTVVLNWHGRTNSQNYKWGETYKFCVNYLLEKGFKQGKLNE